MNKTEIFKIRHTLQDIQKHFELEQRNGRYKLYQLKEGNKRIAVYSNGQADNIDGCITIKSKHFNLKAVIYCLKYSCHYLDIPNAVMYPKNSPNIFEVDDIRCISKGIEWKDALTTLSPLPKAIQTELKLETTTSSVKKDVDCAISIGCYVDGEIFFRKKFLTPKDKVFLKNIIVNDVLPLLV